MLNIDKNIKLGVAIMLEQFPFIAIFKTIQNHRIICKTSFSFLKIEKTFYCKVFSRKLIIEKLSTDTKNCHCCNGKWIFRWLRFNSLDWAFCLVILEKFCLVQIWNLRLVMSLFSCSLWTTSLLLTSS